MGLGRKDDEVVETTSEKSNTPEHPLPGHKGEIGFSDCAR